jgi:hypothetical protein
MAEIQQENASLKGTSRGLATMLEMTRWKKKIVTQLVEALWGCCESEVGQHIPLFLVRICKNQQANARWKCCTTQQS